MLCSPFLSLQVNDTLDDIFDGSDDEEESQDIVNQVLDEIGIEISGKVKTAYFIMRIAFAAFVSGFFFLSTNITACFLMRVRRSASSVFIQMLANLFVLSFLSVI